MFYIYILKSEKNGSYYVGSCKDVDERAGLHNKGSVKSTKRYVPWKVIYNEQYKILSEARKRESQIKSWKRRALIEKLVKIL